MLEGMGSNPIVNNMFFKSIKDDFVISSANQIVAPAFNIINGKKR